MEIKILGADCSKCNKVEKLTREVVEENGINATIKKVEDIVEILRFGILSTPALVVDGKVVIKGRVPTMDEIKKALFK